MLRESGGIDSQDQAIDKFKEAIVHAPHDAHSIFALAQCYERRGAYTLAIPLLRTIEDHPNHSTTQRVRPMLLQCYDKQGEFMAAATLRAKMK